MKEIFYNLRSNFKYQNKYFFEKAYALLEFYKSLNDELYYEENLNGTGYVLLKKKNLNNIEFKIELYCNDEHQWIIKINFNNHIKEMPQHYTEEDFDILQLQKEMIKYYI